MKEAKQVHRSPAETLWLHLLLNVGFSKSLLSQAPLRANASPFGKRSVERAANMLDGRLAHQVGNWPTRPANLEPGKAISSTKQLLEISMMASSLYYLYADRVYEELTMEEILEAIDLYTNIRTPAESGAPQISPDTIFYLCRELIEHKALIPYCPSCEVRYYSSVEQRVRNACPFCRKVGVGDFGNSEH